MSTNFYSHEGTGQGPRRDQPPQLEAQQALLIEVLRRAAGAPVSYDELRRAGVDLPASVVSELELAGFPIERRPHAGPERRRLGVRLNPALDPGRAGGDLTSSDVAAGSPVPVSARVPLPRFSQWRWPASFPGFGGRVLAPLALVAAVLVVAVVVMIGLAAGSGHSRHLARRSRPRATPSARIEAHQASIEQTSTAPVSAALATQFEAQGHELLDAGQYSDAVPILKRAVVATGEQVSDCVEPVSQTCLTYAYALYDLGRALQLNGHPTAAVTVLEQRLQIDNQREVVQTTLDSARSAAP